MSFQLLLFLSGATCMLTSSAYAQDAGSKQGSEWYAQTGQLAERGQSLSLGPGEHTLSTLAGWDCAVSRLSLSGGRQVECSLDQRTVAFSVQCDLQRPADNTQLHFGDGSKIDDYVVVGCQSESATDSPAARIDASDVFTLYRSSSVIPGARYHVATFDTSDGEGYNRQNCELAASLFLKQPFVTVRWWCESGRFREE